MAIARQLWMSIPIAVFQKETGESPYVQKIIIWGAYIASYISFLVSLIFSIIAFKWWSLLIVPASITVFAVFMGMSSVPRGTFFSRGLPVSLLFLASLVFLIYRPDDLYARYAFLFLLSLWCTQLYYDVSTSSLKSLVLRNQKAFEFFQEHLHVRATINE